MNVKLYNYLTLNHSMLGKKIVNIEFIGATYCNIQVNYPGPRAVYKITYVKFNFWF